MIASTGAPGANVYASRWLTRFGTVRPAERGSTMSTYTATLDDTAMLVVGAAAAERADRRGQCVAVERQQLLPAAPDDQGGQRDLGGEGVRDHEVIDEVLAPVAAVDALRRADRVTCNAVVFDAARSGVPSEAPAITARRQAAPSEANHTIPIPSDPNRAARAAARRAPPGSCTCSSATRSAACAFTPGFRTRKGPP